LGGPANTLVNAPYAKSPVQRARVKAAGAAERDDAKDRANVRPAHRDIDRDVYNEKRNVHIRPSGNFRAAFLRRLRKDRPDLHARVLNGALSPYAAMVEAGFRRRGQHRPAVVEKPAPMSR
jgi:hypothetical protein